MKTYLAHSISLSMVPLEIPDGIFDWHFRVVSAEEVFALIHTAQVEGTFENFTSLPMMDSILHNVGQGYGTTLQAPRGHRHMQLGEGDTLIIVRYSGRRLELNDRVLPNNTKLTFYKMQMRVAPTWRDEGDIAVARLVNSL